MIHFWRFLNSMMVGVGVGLLVSQGIKGGDVGQVGLGVALFGIFGLILAKPHELR